jgi:hypothetical protein
MDTPSGVALEPAPPNCTGPTIPERLEVAETRRVKPAGTVTPVFTQASTATLKEKVKALETVAILPASVLTFQ